MSEDLNFKKLNYREIIIFLTVLDIFLRKLLIFLPSVVSIPGNNGINSLLILVNSRLEPKFSFTLFLGCFWDFPTKLDCI